MHAPPAFSDDYLGAAGARLVAGWDVERRALERELHDGIQQQLVALAVNLQLARQLSQTDHDAAVAMLDELRQDVHEALRTAQTLGERIYPPLLATRGLAEAVRAAASSAGVAAEVDAEDGAGALEATVYFCCREALENVAAHAGPGARATVRVERREGVLRFVVADDGGGFDPCAPTSGDGLARIRERLEALCGGLEIVSAPGRGTRIAGVLPLYEPDSAR